jgi:hypothetical protein
MSRLPGRTTQISQLLLVELRGRLSNFDIQRFVRDVLAVMDGNVAVAAGAQAAACGDRCAPEPVRVRLGETAVAELVAAFVAGATMRDLVDRYGVSLSSVKRLLRGSGTLRRGGPASGGQAQ